MIADASERSLRAAEAATAPFGSLIGHRSMPRPLQAKACAPVSTLRGAPLSSVMLATLLLLFFTVLTPAAEVHDYTVKPVPFTAVHLNDVFWAPRIETNRTVTIPFAFEQCEKSGRMDNFDRAAKALRHQELTNRKPPGTPFDDTDPYKVLEGASYCLAVQPDPKMRAYLDGLIDKIADAQEPDGYLYTARTINPEHPHEWSGNERWLKDPDLSHELYDAPFIRSCDSPLPSHWRNQSAAGCYQRGRPALQYFWPRETAHLAWS